MKKVIYFLTGGLLGSALLTAHASDGNLRIIADIVKPTCNLQTKSLTVGLGDLDATELNKINATSAWVPFKFKFSDCVPSTYVWFEFEGETPDSSSGIFMLDNSSESAKGLGLQISRYQMDELIFYPNRSGYADSVSNSGEVGLFARYKTYALPIASGKANATIQFSVTYK
ncbi:long polar fimbrial protein LpfA [Serratia entomophila]|uniref:fimbrial protein n=1 Tax=Serratia entomophila TaxID=42906 RepID=UPI001F274E35|nr:fimbrial protein [Serratia entomophila]UIW17668.1 type 1 fimbrial protein [Serratia entomophila]CAI0973038.1 long polar fimbrial protein LpfA [Serratia entomophila]CAI0973567.1 long polar fimbrial protein LpfA [Serratia entomophila]CAI0987478.1 long polar fimbrial protein LpfA [Serratia entomophila]CAI1099836.1 long polar fimbrial protein LpfA [Serratia entomophila]